MARSLDILLNDERPIPDGSGNLAAAAEYFPLLKDLQCNILTPHSLRNAAYFFLRTKEDDDGGRLKFVLGFLARGNFGRAFVRSAMGHAPVLEKASPNLRGKLRTWSAASESSVGDAEHALLAAVGMPSEYDVRQDYLDYRSRVQSANVRVDGSEGKDRGLIVNVLLTRLGYEKIGGTKPASVAFEEGMVHRRKELNDPDPVPDWNAEYLNSKGTVEIHALLVVSYNPTENGIQDQRLNALRGLLGAYTDVIREERGEALKVGGDAPTSYRIEPFGFRDSISQPLFYEADVIDKAGLQIESTWDPRAKLGLVLSPDPNPRTAFACGTYFVYRKLEQHIEQFWAQSIRIADSKHRPPEDIRADLVGRLPDGQPLAATGGGSSQNNFDFSEDQNGERCPFHSHVRKSNPRFDVKAAYKPRDKRIVRRGLPYGPAIRRDAQGAPVFQSGKMLTAKGDAYDRQKDGDIGLLFLCAQSEISSQFEHIQSQWANNEAHPRGNKASGADTVTGQVPPSETNEVAIRDGNPALTRSLDTIYQAVVTLRGGEYFFAPSLGFLRGLVDEVLTS